MAVRLAAVAVLLVGGATAAWAHSTTSAISVSRSFSAETVSPGDTVTVTLTVEFDAIGADPVRGFFISDHIPAGLSPGAGTVTLGGNPVSPTVETGEEGSIYAGCTTSRWVLETPPAWSEGIPIPASSTLVISYQVTIPSGATNGALTFPGYTWVAMIAALGAAGDHFGYEDTPATLTVQGGVDPGDPDAGSSGTGDGGGNGATGTGDLRGGCAAGGHASGAVLILLVGLLFATRRRATR